MRASRRCDEASGATVLVRTLVRPVAVVAAMSQVRAGTRAGERTSEAISEAKDDELAELFPGQADGADNRCADCNRAVTKQATRCLKCAAKKRLADGKYTSGPEINPIAPPAQKRDRAPLTLAKKRRAWKEAGGGTEQFDIDEYDRLMELGK